MYVSTNVCAEDLVIAILEDIFHDEIDLSYPTFPVPGIRSKGQARAMNSMKRYACQHLNVTCHGVLDDNNKHTNLKKLFHTKLDEARKSFQPCKQFAVPNKEESIKPLEKILVVPEEQHRYAEMIERHNMGQEDLTILKVSHTLEEQDAQKVWSKAVQKRMVIETAPSNPSALDESIISDIGFNYILDENSELHDLLYEVFEVMNAMRGSKAAKERIAIKKKNKLIEEEAKEAEEYNQREMEKYNKVMARIREQKQMRHEESLSIRFNLLEAEEERNKAIEEHNNQEKEKYRLYLQQKVAWEQSQRLSQSNLEIQAEQYRRANNNTTLFPQVSDVDILWTLYYLRECCPSDGNSPPRNRDFQRAAQMTGLRTIAHRRFFERTFLREGRWIASVLPNIHDFVYFRSRSLKLIFALENNEISFFGLTHQQVVDLIESLDLHAIFSNIVLRIRQMVVAGRCVREGWGDSNMMPIERARDIVRNRATPTADMPVPYVPKLKKIPAKMKEETIEVKIAEKLGEPNFTSRKKLKKKLIPKLLEDITEPLPSVEEIDYMALLYGLSMVTDSVIEAREKIKKIFGEFPKFRMYTFIESHRKLLTKMRPVLTAIVNDWFLGIDIRRRMEGTMNQIKLEHNYDRFFDSKKKRKEKMLQLKPRVYKLRQVVKLVENDIVNVQQKRQESLEKSNKFHAGSINDSILLKKVYTLSKQEKKNIAEGMTDEEEDLSRVFEDIKYTAEEFDEAPMFSESRGVLSRLAIRSEARKVIETIGNPCLRKVPTHMLENMFFASATLGYCPKLHVAVRDTAKTYHRTARIAFHRNTIAVRH